MHGCGDTRQHCVLKKNDITYVPANVDNQWEFDQGNPHCLHILINETFYNRTALTSFEIDPVRLEPIGEIQSNDPRMQLIAQLLHKELYHRSQTGSLYIESIVTAMTMLLLENYSNAPHTHKNEVSGQLGSEKLQRVHDLMISRLEGGLSLERMATEVSLSPYHFARLFKASMGVSPGKYFLQLRLEHAKLLLLRNPRLKIAMVAQQCGFTDQAYLARHFRRRFGISPTRLRAQHLQ